MTFEQWLAAELPRMLRFAVVLCGGRDPAEEVVQDVAVKVHARWPKIEGLEHREAYVRRMIVNEYLSWRRKWSRIVPQAEFSEELRSPGADVADRYADRSELAAQLKRLPRKQKAVLVLRYLEGLPDAEIADVLGCSAVTVRTHASRGLAALRVEMAPPAARHDSEEGSHAY